MVLNWGQSLLELHVLTIKVVLNDISGLWYLFHQIFELRTAKDVLPEFFSVQTGKSSQSYIEGNVMRSAQIVDGLVVYYRYIG